MRDNVVLEKSKKFAIKIITFYKSLYEHNEYVLSKQILRSGTSIGANIRESMNAQSNKDFVSKMNIALKEADETMYWLEIMLDSNTITQESYNYLYGDAQELVKLLTAIIKTSKQTYEN